MLHKFYVGSRETGIAGMQIYGDSKKEAIQRLIKMTGGEIPFVYFNSPGQGVDVVSDVLHETSDICELRQASSPCEEPSPEAYLVQQGLQMERSTIEELL